jgi:hypothetical protein
MKIFFQLLFMMALLTSPNASLRAQGPPGGHRPPSERKEDIEALKVGFLTRRLQLSPDEAKKFWPVYNQFTEEMQGIREARFAKLKELKDDFDKMNEKDAEKIVDGEIVFRQQELDVLKKYHAQFKQILPIKKVAKLYRAEEDFKRELLDRIRDRRDRKPGER